MMASTTNTWKTVKFGDIATQKKESVDRENNPFDRYVEGGHLDSEELQIRRFGVFSDDYVGPAFHRIFRKGQVVYGSRRTYLKKVAVADFDGITSNTTFVIEPIGTTFFHPDLLPYIMLSEGFTRHSVVNSKGSTNPYINWSDISNYEFKLPPIRKQKKSLAVLGKIERQIRDVYALIESQNQLLASTQLSAFKKEFVFSSNRSSIPPGWNRIRIRDLLLCTPESGFSAHEVDRETKLFVLNLNCLTKFGYRPKGFKNIAPSEKFERYKLLDGDLLISRANTSDLVGLTGIYEDSCKRTAIFPDTMWRLKVNEKVVSRQYLKNFLLSPYARLRLKMIAAGTSGSMKKINKKFFQEIEVSVPPYKEQDAINETIEKIMSMRDTLENKLQSLKNLRYAITEDLLKQEQ